MSLIEKYEELFKSYKDRSIREFVNEINKVLETNKKKIDELKEKALKDIIAK